MESFEQHLEENCIIFLTFYRTLPTGTYAWIGFTDLHGNDTFYWLNGRNVESGYTNWKDGKFEE